MDFCKRAFELKEEIVRHRRYFHQHAEVGLEMPLACAYIKEELEKLGIEPKTCGRGVTATIGSGGKVLLLRADMDALPMEEESGEEFACLTGREAHTCGHDFHAAILLGAAKLLKEKEKEWKGTVKLMFQPAEETLEGCMDMIEAGILEAPQADAALAFHVIAGKCPPGTFLYNSKRPLMSSVDNFRLEISGKGGHGAYPNLTVDPIRMGVQVHQCFQGLIAREANPKKLAVLTIGKFQAGNTGNVIPAEAEMEGALRTDDAEVRKYLTKRVEEVVQGVGELNRGAIRLQWLSQIPCLSCSEELTRKMARYIGELEIDSLSFFDGMEATASEDFACIAERVPSAYFYLSAGFPDERGDYPAHNPKVRFNEEVLPLGAAAMAHCAARWLES